MIENLPAPEKPENRAAFPLARTLGACVVLLMVVEPVSAQNPQPTWRVGAAAVNILADDRMAIGGSIGPSRADGQEGELRATSIVIEDGCHSRVAIVTCDALFTPADLVEAAIRRITKSTGIPHSHILVNATHTHHAPSTARIHGCEREELFCRRLVDAVVKSVEQADASAKTGEPAQLLFALGEEATVGANSRLLLKDNRIHWFGSKANAIGPTGPFDPQLPVLAFRRNGGDLCALLFNHSTHTQGTRRRNVRSPSFYGLAAQELEQELGVVAGFVQGASGSTHNITGVPTAEAVIRIKQAVKVALKEAEPRPAGDVRSAKRRFCFRVRHFDEQLEDTMVSGHVLKYAPGLADKTIRIFRDMRRELARQQGASRETWIQAIVLGDVALVGLPAEYFASLASRIKKESPFQYTYIAELANDWIGYLPDREAHRLGGYQTWTGLHSYAEIGTGERMASAALELLEHLHRQPDSGRTPR